MRHSLACLLAALLLLPGCSMLGSSVTVAEGVISCGDIFFLDPQHGWIVGRDEKEKAAFMARTVDGGKTWESVRYPGKATITGVAFTDPMNGVALGTHYTAFKTRDGGVTWEDDEARGDTRFLDCQGDRAVQLLGGWGMARRKGASFLKFSGKEFESVGYRDQLRSGRILSPSSAQIVDKDNVWFFDSTSIFHGDAKGNGLREIRIAESQSGSTVVNAVTGGFFLDGKRGWLAYKNGDLRYTEDGAKTRKERTWPLATAGIPWELHFFDENQGVALGDKQLLKTSDGGQSWSVIRDFPDEYHQRARMFVLDRDHLWLAYREKSGLKVEALAVDG